MSGKSRPAGGSGKSRTSKSSATREKATFTKASARKAAEAAKEAFARSPKLPKSWKPGGKEYERVLGHFGVTQG